MHERLQPHVMGAATICTRGCNPIQMEPRRGATEAGWQERTSEQATAAARAARAAHALMGTAMPPLTLTLTPPLTLTLTPNLTLTLTLILTSTLTRCAAVAPVESWEDWYVR